MVLLKPEQDALLAWMARMDQAGFGAFLLATANVRLSQCSAETKNMLAIFVDFVGWLDTHANMIPPILRAAALQADQSEEAPILAAAATRLLAIQQKVIAAGPPVQARLAGGVPIVNRS